MKTEELEQELKEYGLEAVSEALNEVQDKFNLIPHMTEKEVLESLKEALLQNAYRKGIINFLKEKINKLQ